MAEWNLGKKDRKGLKKEGESAILVGIIREGQPEAMVKEYLAELEFLAMTAGATTKKVFTQKLKQPHPKTFIGSGKLQEIHEYIENHEEINLVIFDDDLTGCLLDTSPSPRDQRGSRTPSSA